MPAREVIGLFVPIHTTCDSAAYCQTSTPTLSQNNAAPQTMQQHTLTHAHARTRTQTQRHKQTHTQTHTHTRTYTYTEIQTHTQTRTRDTDTHADTHLSGRREEHDRNGKKKSI